MPRENDRHITLPKWLDDLLFNKLSASYCRKNKDLVVLDWGHNCWSRLAPLVYLRGGVASFITF